ncbi:MAG: hypothetical protein K0R63_692 [Rickettsiales bacterium]|jgi:zinc transport system permease protein|nr:hypothetical protein [Rickettsiales bacterium]
MILGLDDFIIRAALGGMGVAIVAGPLGAFVVWRRMAYFGDALSHSALLGVALAILCDIHIMLGIVIFALFFSVAVAYLQRGKSYSSDTILGIMAHGALATGLVAIALVDTIQLDLLPYLFGDILAISDKDIITIYLSGVGILLGLALIWNPLLLSTLHTDLARARGIPVDRLRLVFMLLLALLVALSIKIVGVLLITALLVVPAAAARGFARTPEQMALYASLIGCIGVCGGLGGSLATNAPAGPAIVVVCVIGFMLSMSISSLLKSR